MGFVEWWATALTTWVPWVLVGFVVLWCVGVVDNHIRRY